MGLQRAEDERFVLRSLTGRDFDWDVNYVSMDGIAADLVIEQNGREIYKAKVARSIASTLFAVATLESQADAKDTQGFRERGRFARRELGQRLGINLLT